MYSLKVCEKRRKKREKEKREDLSPFVLKVPLMEVRDTQFVCGVCVRARPPLQQRATRWYSVASPSKTASQRPRGRYALMGEDFILGRP